MIIGIIIQVIQLKSRPKVFIKKLKPVNFI